LPLRVSIRAAFALMPTSRMPEAAPVSTSAAASAGTEVAKPGTSVTAAKTAHDSETCARAEAVDGRSREEEHRRQRPDRDEEECDAERPVGRSGRRLDARQHRGPGAPEETESAEPRQRSAEERAIVVCRHRRRHPHQSPWSASDVRSILAFGGAPVPASLVRSRER
jgi:hypothetical protein